MKNRGLTLLEVVTSVAILGFVIVAVTGFINTGVKTSSRTNAEANLQKEAQTSINQMTDWIMSANHGIAVYPACTAYDKAVVIYRDGENATDKYVQILYYVAADKRIYYDKVEVSGSFTGTEAQIQNHASTIQSEYSKHLFCEYVEDFDLKIDNISKNYVDLKLVLKLQDIEYNKQPKRITLRNPQVTAPAVYY